MQKYRNREFLRFTELFFLREFGGIGLWAVDRVHSTGSSVHSIVNHSRPLDSRWAIKIRSTEGVCPIKSGPSVCGSTAQIRTRRGILLI
jgi:hypothetical protein